MDENILSNNDNNENINLNKSLLSESLNENNSFIDQFKVQEDNLNKQVNDIFIDSEKLKLDKIKFNEEEINSILLL